MIDLEAAKLKAEKKLEHPDYHPSKWVDVVIVPVYQRGILIKLRYQKRLPDMDGWDYLDYQID